MDSSASRKWRLAWLSAFAALLPLSSAHADDWPQWRGPNRDGVWHEKNILEQFPPTGLEVRWRKPVGDAYSAPVIVKGRVYVTDCKIDKEKREAHERIHCFDEATGNALWTKSYAADYPDFTWEDGYFGPVATPIVQSGKLWMAGSAGNLACLDAVNGDILWSKNMAKDYGIGGDFCRTGSPLIEGDLVIFQTATMKPKAGLYALEKDTGKERWHALDGHGYYTSPVIVEAGGKRQLIAVDERTVSSLDPATGNIFWKEKFVAGRAIPTPVASGNRLLVNGLMFALDASTPTAKVVWPERRPDAYLSDTTTAVFVGDLIVSHKAPNRLACLDAATGKILWDTDKINSTMHTLTRNGDAVFLMTDQGELLRIEVSVDGFRETARAKLIKPTTAFGKDKKVHYSAPSYANGHVFVRNGEEVICASLMKPEKK